MTHDVDPNADEYSAVVGGLIVAAGQVDLAVDPSEIAERRAYVEKLAKRLIALDHVGTVVELALFSGRMLNRDARRQQLNPLAELEKIEAQMLLDDDGDATS